MEAASSVAAPPQGPKMKNRLKWLRAKDGMTQSKLAKAVGVTQPTVQRWESGELDISDAHIAKLAKALKTTPDAVLGRYAPMEAAFYDDRAPEELQYYGEAAIHFRSGAKPLLLSISEAEHSRFFRDLQDNTKFLNVRDLGNRLLVLRREALADVYFSSEAYDWFGPEHDDEDNRYEDDTPVQLPDPRDWKIIEQMSWEDEDIGEDFAKEDIDRVQQCVMITDEQYEKLVADGLIKPEDLESEKAKNAATIERILERAREVVYQISVGPHRTISISSYDARVVFDAFYRFIEPDAEDSLDGGLCCFPSEGYHRTSFINPNAIDYISIPAHIYDEGEIDAFDESTGGLDDDESDKIVKLPQTRRRRGGRRRAQNEATATTEAKAETLPPPPAWQRQADLLNLTEIDILRTVAESADPAPALKNLTTCVRGVVSKGYLKREPDGHLTLTPDGVQARAYLASKSAQQ
jgi:transcriptional regulator with XRE-family HTH domain